jgi:hypothetical protein
MFPPDDISSSASVRFLAIGSDNDPELDCGGAGLLVPNPNFLFCFESQPYGCKRRAILVRRSNPYDTNLSSNRQ